MLQRAWHLPVSTARRAAWRNSAHSREISVSLLRDLQSCGLMQTEALASCSVRPECFKRSTELQEAQVLSSSVATTHRGLQFRSGKVVADQIQPRLRWRTCKFLGFKTVDFRSDPQQVVSDSKTMIHSPLSPSHRWVRLKAGIPFCCIARILR